MGNVALMSQFLDVELLQSFFDADCQIHRVDASMTSKFDVRCQNLMLGVKFDNRGHF